MGGSLHLDLGLGQLPLPLPLPLPIKSVFLLGVHFEMPKSDFLPSLLALAGVAIEIVGGGDGHGRVELERQLTLVRCQIFSINFLAIWGYLEQLCFSPFFDNFVLPRTP